MKLNVSRLAGFTLVEIMIVCAIVGLLSCIAIPNFIASRKSSNRSVCIANLRQMNDAKITWAMEAKKSSTDLPADTELFGTDKYLRTKPQCPASGLYNVGKVDTRSACNLGSVDGHTL